MHSKKLYSVGLDHQKATLQEGVCFHQGWLLGHWFGRLRLENPHLRIWILPKGLAIWDILRQVKKTPDVTSNNSWTHFQHFPVGLFSQTMHTTSRRFSGMLGSCSEISISQFLRVLWRRTLSEIGPSYKGEHDLSRTFHPFNQRWQ